MVSHPSTDRAQYCLTSVEGHFPTQISGLDTGESHLCRLDFDLFGYDPLDQCLQYSNPERQEVKFCGAETFAGAMWRKISEEIFGNALEALGKNLKKEAVQKIMEEFMLNSDFSSLCK